MGKCWHEHITATDSSCGWSQTKRQRLSPTVSQMQTRSGGWSRLKQPIEENETQHGNCIKFKKEMFTCVMTIISLTINLFHVGWQGEDSKVHSTYEGDSGEGRAADWRAYSPDPAIAQEEVSSSWWPTVNFTIWDRWLWGTVHDDWSVLWRSAVAIRSAVGTCSML